MTDKRQIPLSGPDQVASVLKKRIIKAGEIDLAPQINPFASANREEPAKEATARPIMQGDVVTAVEITCQCGRKMVLHLDYGNE